MGYLLASPLRALGESPKKILAPLVEPGMTAVDVGCAMGFFSLPMARMVGESGRVVCVDLQARMLSTLKRRARRRGLGGIIETRHCGADDLGLDDLGGQADLVLAAHVVHEVPDPRRLLATCRRILKPGGRLLLIEPRGHVSAEEFETTAGLAGEAGLQELELDPIGRSHQRLFGTPVESAG
jgi:ubiquinone/menaquinone biosynthesis C-methylase UbiE